MCVDRHQWRVLVFRLPHTPTLPGRRGFLLRPVARLPRPRVLSTTRKSATLCPSPLRVLLIGRGFIAPPGDLRCQNSRASSGKAYDLPACRPASHRFDTAGYWVSLAQACSTLSPMPYSRFAVRYVRRFYLMLPPDPSSLTAPLPCWCRPSVRSRWAVLLPVDIHQKVGQYAMPSTLVRPAHGRAGRSHRVVSSRLAKGPFRFTYLSFANLHPWGTCGRGLHYSTDPRSTTEDKAISSQPLAQDRLIALAYNLAFSPLSFRPRGAHCRAPPRACRSCFEACSRIVCCVISIELRSYS